MKRSFLYRAIAMLLILLSSVSCNTIHKFPNDGVDPTLLMLGVDLNITISEIVDEFEDYPIEMSGEDQQRLILEVYDYSDTQTAVYRAVKLINSDSDLTETNNIEVLLAASKYKVLAWVDYVKKGSEADKYYNTTDNGLYSVSLAEPLTSDVDERLSLYGSKDIDLTIYNDEWYVSITDTIDLYTPVSRYVMIADDVDKYIEDLKSKAESVEWDDISTYTAKIAYDGFLPNAVNSSTGELSGSKVGLSYESKVKLLETGEAQIAMDYPFTAKSSETTVNAVVYIYDANGDLVNENADVSFKVTRGELTIYRADLFTKEVKSSGITILTEYDGVFNIVIDDDGSQTMTTN